MTHSPSTLSVRPPERPIQPRPRPSSALRDRAAIGWLALALLAALAHPWVPGLTWLTVHLVLLGALTHSIMVWSHHFSQALLKTAPSPDASRRQDRRIILHIVGVLAVLAGVTGSLWWLTVTGATLVSVAVTWHGVVLWRRLRAALPGRFRITIRYYLAAAACLPVGAVFGVLLAGGPDAATQGRYLLAHSVTMVLGWAGLTVTGTLVTLWPTILRTRLDERAERLTRQALPVFLGALVVVDAAALTGWRLLSVGGMLGYLLALLWWGRALLRPARTAPPKHASSWSVTAALVWLFVSVVLIGVRVALTPSWEQLTGSYDTIALIIAAGFASQILIGALSYLMPVVLGGGAEVWRAGQSEFDRWAVARVVVVNLGLLLWALPGPPAVHTLVGALVLLALGSFIPILLLATRAALKVKAARENTPPGQRRELPPEKSIWSPGQLVAGVAAVAVALSVGVAWNPSAAGLTGAALNSPGTSAAAQVRPTGHTTRVSVEAIGMRFKPSTITVPRGDRLVIDLVNQDPTTPHDLVLDNGADSGRLMPGQRTTLDAGIISADMQGWCSVVGHRQMGMTMSIVVTGGAAGSGDTTGTPADSGHDTMGQAAPTVVPDQDVPAGFTAADPTLPALSDDTVHKVTFTVEETKLEVAPGIWQTRWTYGGTVPGPTLHGRVGDTFEVTLVNKTSMGHSIDFHAGELAPDGPMRTIPPGDSLRYTFTATRSGIWMYHCASEPMSAHIGAGLYGAVIIEPPDLAPVSASYVIQQGAAYVLGDGRSPIEQVDADAALAERPTFVTFNGMAFQYDHRPITVRAGERIRIWLLDAGPSRPLSFHVVGGQFDTTYAEGAYLLRNGKDAFGAVTGGAQALALQPAQGGFVEITFPEPGTYPFVSHIMADAEHGAHGLFRVEK